MSTESDLQAFILEMITKTAEGITPQEACLQADLKLGSTQKQARKAVRGLLDAGEIQYAIKHGRTVVIPSIQGHVQVSERIVLSPPGQNKTKNHRNITVFLSPGSAFGLGDHPTTCLSLQLLDRVFDRLKNSDGIQVLDIGTGSGVLLIASLKLGAARGLGLDTDPCARRESLENLRINGLEHVAEIRETSFVSLEGEYGLVTANLREPPLTRVFEVAHRFVKSPGIMVVSGFRPEEAGNVRHSANRHHFRQEEYLAERGWAAMVFCSYGEHPFSDQFQ